jgi:hypothetical protein
VARAMNRLRLAGAGSSQEWARRGFRALFGAALLVVLLLGLRDIARPFLAGGQPRTAAAPASYPSQAAEAFAARFALAYLTYDAAHPDQRQQALQQYVSGDVVSVTGWDGQGRQTAVEALPGGIEVQGGDRALVTVAALVDRGRWVYLSVPVVADGERLAVDGTPALLPPPTLADTAPPDDVADMDPILSGQLMPSVTAFLRAYAASSQAELAYYAAPGVAYAGLAGQVTLAGLDALSIDQSSGSQRSAVAVVRWTDARSGGTLTQRYRLQLVQANGKWLVADVGPAE